MNKQEQAERLKEMIRLYEVEKWTLRQIGDHFGVTWQAIHERLVRAGVKLRPKSPKPKFFDRETLVRLYIEEKLSLEETAKCLNSSCSKIAQELEKHGIERRSQGFFHRKYPELYQLKIGEKIIIKRPAVSNIYKSLYEKAQRAGIQISIKSVNDEKLEIYRKK